MFCRRGFAVFLGLFYLLVKVKYGESQCDLSVEFPCRNNTSLCIPRERLRDGVPDCPDQSDEECSLSEFDCGGGSPKCIDSSQVQDGKIDCQNGKDEGCSDKHFMCSDKSACIPYPLRRDGIFHCDDGSDEEPCGENEFSCGPKGLCILLSSFQDGIEDCPDGSDEECLPHQFQCLCGFPRCLEPEAIRNGKIDCLEGSDEVDIDKENFDCSSISEDAYQTLDRRKRQMIIGLDRAGDLPGLPLVFTPVAQPTGFLGSSVETVYRNGFTTILTMETHGFFNNDGFYQRMLNTRVNVLQPPVLRGDFRDKFPSLPEFTPSFSSRFNEFESFPTRSISLITDHLGYLESSLSPFPSNEHASTYTENPENSRFLLKFSMVDKSDQEDSVIKSEDEQISPSVENIKPTSVIKIPGPRSTITANVLISGKLLSNTPVPKIPNHSFTLNSYEEKIKDPFRVEKKPKASDPIYPAYVITYTVGQKSKHIARSSSLKTATMTVPKMKTAEKQEEIISPTLNVLSVHNTKEITIDKIQIKDTSKPSRRPESVTPVLKNQMKFDKITSDKNEAPLYTHTVGGYNSNSLPRARFLRPSPSIIRAFPPIPSGRSLPTTTSEMSRNMAKRTRITLKGFVHFTTTVSGTEIVFLPQTTDKFNENFQMYTVSKSYPSDIVSTTATIDNNAIAMNEILDSSRDTLIKPGAEPTESKHILIPPKSKENTITILATPYLSSSMKEIESSIVIPTEELSIMTKSEDVVSKLDKPITEYEGTLEKSDVTEIPSSDKGDKESKSKDENIQSITSAIESATVGGFEKSEDDGKRVQTETSNTLDFTSFEILLPTKHKDNSTESLQTSDSSTAHLSPFADMFDIADLEAFPSPPAHGPVDEEFPTGLISSTEGSTENKGTTTFFTTVVIGTMIDGNYAQVVQSTSSLLYVIGNNDEIITNSINSVPPNEMTTADINPTSIITEYTTFTHFSTVMIGDFPSVISSYDTVSNIVTKIKSEDVPRKNTESLQTQYLTFTHFTTLLSDNFPTVTSSFEIVKNIITETNVQNELKPTNTLPLITSEITRTSLSTLTHYTTVSIGQFPFITSSLKIVSEIITDTLIIAPSIIEIDPTKSLSNHVVTLSSFNTSDDLLHSVVSGKEVIINNIADNPTERKINTDSESTVIELSRSYSTIYRGDTSSIITDAVSNAIINVIHSNDNSAIGKDDKQPHHSYVTISRGLNSSVDNKVETSVLNITRSDGIEMKSIETKSLASISEIIKTMYTTFTEYTTKFYGEFPSVLSSLHIISNVVTESVIQFSTPMTNIETIVSTASDANKTIPDRSTSDVPQINIQESTPVSLNAQTQYQTYTYYTTFFIGDQTSITSNEVTSSTIIIQSQNFSETSKLPTNELPLVNSVLNTDPISSSVESTLPISPEKVQITTYTFFTTYFKDGMSFISSSEEVVTVTASNQIPQPSLSPSSDSELQVSSLTKSFSDNDFTVKTFINNITFFTTLFLDSSTSVITNVKMETSTFTILSEHIRRNEIATSASNEMTTSSLNTVEEQLLKPEIVSQTSLESSIASSPVLNLQSVVTETSTVTNTYYTTFFLDGSTSVNSHEVINTNYITRTLEFKQNSFIPSAIALDSTMENSLSAFSVNNSSLTSSLIIKNEMEKTIEVTPTNSEQPQSFNTFTYFTTFFINGTTSISSSIIVIPQSKSEQILETITNTNEMNIKTNTTRKQLEMELSENIIDENVTKFSEEEQLQHARNVNMKKDSEQINTKDTTIATGNSTVSQDMLNRSFKNNPSVPTDLTVFPITIPSGREGKSIRDVSEFAMTNFTDFSEWFTTSKMHDEIEKQNTNELGSGSFFITPAPLTQEMNSFNDTNNVDSSFSSNLSGATNLDPLLNTSSILSNLVTTLYTTYTYYTTLFSGNQVSLSTRHETVTNVVTNSMTITPSPTAVGKTFYTTFTYFTTFIKEGVTSISSREETKSNVITDTTTFSSLSSSITDSSYPLTKYTTFTYFTTAYTNGTSTILSREEVKSTVYENSNEYLQNNNVLLSSYLGQLTNSAPILTSPVAEPSALATTYYTTFTYYTTSYSGDQTFVTSRLETSSNIVVGTNPIISSSIEVEAIFTPSSAVANTTVSSIVAPSPVFPTSSPGNANVSVSPIQTSSVEEKISNLSQSDSSSLLKPTGLLSTLSSINIDQGLTTAFFTEVYGTYINGMYAHIQQSSSSVYVGAQPNQNNRTSVIITQPIAEKADNPFVVTPTPLKKLYPTGLVTETSGTVVNDGTSTLFTSRVLGTYIDGTYAQIVESTSRIILGATIASNIQEKSEPVISPTLTEDIYKTGLVSKIPGSTEVNERLTTIHETHVLGTYIEGAYAQILQPTSTIIQGNISEPSSSDIIKLRSSESTPNSTVLSTLSSETANTSISDIKPTTSLRLRPSLRPFNTRLRPNNFFNRRISSSNSVSVSPTTTSSSVTPSKTRSSFNRFGLTSGSRSSSNYGSKGSNTRASSPGFRGSNLVGRGSSIRSSLGGKLSSSPNGRSISSYIPKTSRSRSSTTSIKGKFTFRPRNSRFGIFRSSILSSSSLSSFTPTSTLYHSYSSSSSTFPLDSSLGHIPTPPLSSEDIEKISNTEDDSEENSDSTESRNPPSNEEEATTPIDTDEYQDNNADNTNNRQKVLIRPFRPGKRRPYPFRNRNKKEQYDEFENDDQKEAGSELIEVEEYAPDEMLEQSVIPEEAEYIVRKKRFAAEDSVESMEKIPVNRRSKYGMKDSSFRDYQRPYRSTERRVQKTRVSRPSARKVTIRSRLSSRKESVTKSIAPTTSENLTLKPTSAANSRTRGRPHKSQIRRSSKTRAISPSSSTETSTSIPVISTATKTSTRKGRARAKVVTTTSASSVREKITIRPSSTRRSRTSVTRHRSDTARRRVTTRRKISNSRNAPRKTVFSDSWTTTAAKNSRTKPTPVLPTLTIITVTHTRNTTKVLTIFHGRETVTRTLQTTALSEQTLRPEEYSTVNDNGIIKTLLSSTLTTDHMSPMLTYVTEVLITSSVKPTFTISRLRGSGSGLETKTSTSTLYGVTTVTRTSTHFNLATQSSNPLASLLLPQLLLNQFFPNNQISYSTSYYSTVTTTTVLVTSVIPLVYRDKTKYSTLSETKIVPSNIITSTTIPVTSAPNFGPLNPLFPLFNPLQYQLLNQQQSLNQQQQPLSQQQQQLLNQQQQQQLLNQPNQPLPTYAEQLPLSAPTKFIESEFESEEEIDLPPPRRQKAHRVEKIGPITSVLTLYLSGNEPGKYNAFITTVTLDSPSSNEDDDSTRVRRAVGLDPQAVTSLLEMTASPELYDLIGDDESYHQDLRNDADIYLNSAMQDVDEYGIARGYLETQALNSIPDDKTEFIEETVIEDALAEDSYETSDSSEFEDVDIEDDNAENEKSEEDFNVRQKRATETDYDEDISPVISSDDELRKSKTKYMTYTRYVTKYKNGQLLVTSTEETIARVNTNNYKYDELTKTTDRIEATERPFTEKEEEEEEDDYEEDEDESEPEETINSKSTGKIVRITKTRKIPLSNKFTIRPKPRIVETKPSVDEEEDNEEEDYLKTEDVDEEDEEEGEDESEIETAPASDNPQETEFDEKDSEVDSSSTSSESLLTEKTLSTEKFGSSIKPTRSRVKIIRVRPSSGSSPASSKRIKSTRRIKIIPKTSKESVDIEETEYVTDLQKISTNDVNINDNLETTVNSIQTNIKSSSKEVLSIPTKPIPLTYFTTFTYYSTVIKDDDTTVKSREAVTSHVSTETLNSDLISIIQSNSGYSTPHDGPSMLNFGTRTRDGVMTVVNAGSRVSINDGGQVPTTTRQRIKITRTRHVRPSITPTIKSKLDSAKDQAKNALRTYLTIYTYFYTFIDDEATRFSSSEATHSEIVTGTAKPLPDDFARTENSFGVYTLKTDLKITAVGSRVIHGTTTSVNLGDKTIVMFGNVPRSIKPSKTIASNAATVLSDNTVKLESEIEESSSEEITRNTEEKSKRIFATRTRVLRPGVKRQRITRTRILSSTPVIESSFESISTDESLDRYSTPFLSEESTELFRSKFENKHSTHTDNEHRLETLSSNDVESSSVNENTHAADSSVRSSLSRPGSSSRSRLTIIRSRQSQSSSSISSSLSDSPSYSTAHTRRFGSRRPYVSRTKTSTKKLPSNVIYVTYTTTTLVPFLGGTQTRTLNIVTSSLRTLSPEEFSSLSASESQSNLSPTSSTNVEDSTSQSSSSVSESETKDSEQTVGILSTSTTSPSLSSTYRPVSSSSSHSSVLASNFRGSSYHSSGSSSPSKLLSYSPRGSQSLHSSSTQKLHSSSHPSSGSPSSKSHSSTLSLRSSISPLHSTSILSTSPLESVNITRTVLDTISTTVTFIITRLDGTSHVVSTKEETSTDVITRIIIETVAPTLSSSSETIVPSPVDVFSRLALNVTDFNGLQGARAINSSSLEVKQETTSPHPELHSEMTTKVMPDNITLVVATSHGINASVQLETDTVIPSQTMSPTLSTESSTTVDKEATSPLDLSQSSINDKSFPPTISSSLRSSSDPVISKTIYKTFTYFTTYFSGNNTNVISREEISSTVVTDPIAKPSITATTLSSDKQDSFSSKDHDLQTTTLYTTLTYLNLFNTDNSSLTLTRKSTLSKEYVYPVDSSLHVSSKELETKTYFKTNTFFSTDDSGPSQVIHSTEEILTEVIITEAPSIVTETIKPSTTIKATFETGKSESSTTVGSVLLGISSLTQSSNLPPLSAEESSSSTSTEREYTFSPSESSSQSSSSESETELALTSSITNTPSTTFSTFAPPMTEVITLTKTYFTTFTYFTTYLEGNSITTTSSIDVVTNTVHQTIHKLKSNLPSIITAPSISKQSSMISSSAVTLLEKPENSTLKVSDSSSETKHTLLLPSVTTSPTMNDFSSSKDETPTSLIVTSSPVLNSASVTAFVTKTYFTTFTYFTTYFDGTQTSISTNRNTVSRVVTEPVTEIPTNSRISESPVIDQTMLTSKLEVDKSASSLTSSQATPVLPNNIPLSYKTLFTTFTTFTTFFEGTNTRIETNINIKTDIITVTPTISQFSAETTKSDDSFFSAALSDNSNENTSSSKSSASVISGSTIIFFSDVTIPSSSTETVTETSALAENGIPTVTSSLQENPTESSSSRLAIPNLISTILVSEPFVYVGQHNQPKEAMKNETLYVVVDSLKRTMTLTGPEMTEILTNNQNNKPIPSTSTLSLASVTLESSPPTLSSQQPQSSSGNSAANSGGMVSHPNGGAGFLAGVAPILGGLAAALISTGSMVGIAARNDTDKNNNIPSMVGHLPPGAIVPGANNPVFIPLQNGQMAPNNQPFLHQQNGPVFHAQPMPLNPPAINIAPPVAFTDNRIDNANNGGQLFNTVPIQPVYPGTFKPGQTEKGFTPIISGPTVAFEATNIGGSSKTTVTTVLQGQSTIFISRPKQNFKPSIATYTLHGSGSDDNYVTADGLYQQSVIDGTTVVLALEPLHNVDRAGFHKTTLPYEQEGAAAETVEHSVLALASINDDIQPSITTVYSTFTYFTTLFDKSTTKIISSTEISSKIKTIYPGEEVRSGTVSSLVLHRDNSQEEIKPTKTTSISTTDIEFDDSSDQDNSGEKRRVHVGIGNDRNGFGGHRVNGPQFLPVRVLPNPPPNFGVIQFPQEVHILPNAFHPQPGIIRPVSNSEFIPNFGVVQPVQFPHGENNKNDLTQSVIANNQRIGNPQNGHAPLQTTYLTYTHFITSFVNGKQVVSTHEQIVSTLINPTSTQKAHEGSTVFISVANGAESNHQNNFGLVQNVPNQQTTTLFFQSQPTKPLGGDISAHGGIGISKLDPLLALNTNTIITDKADVIHQTVFRNGGIKEDRFDQNVGLSTSKRLMTFTYFTTFVNSNGIRDVTSREEIVTQIVTPTATATLISPTTSSVHPPLEILEVHHEHVIDKEKQHALDQSIASILERDQASQSATSISSSAQHTEVTKSIQSVIFSQLEKQNTHSTVSLHTSLSAPSFSSDFFNEASPIRTTKFMTYTRYFTTIISGIQSVSSSEDILPTVVTINPIISTIITDRSDTVLDDTVGIIRSKVITTSLVSDTVNSASTQLISSNDKISDIKPTSTMAIQNKNTLSSKVNISVSNVHGNIEDTVKSTNFLNNLFTFVNEVTHSTRFVDDKLKTTTDINTILNTANRNVSTIKLSTTSGETQASTEIAPAVHTIPNLSRNHTETSSNNPLTFRTTTEAISISTGSIFEKNNLDKLTSPNIIDNVFTTQKTTTTESGIEGEVIIHDHTASPDIKRNDTVSNASAASVVTPALPVTPSLVAHSTETISSVSEFYVTPTARINDPTKLNGSFASLQPVVKTYYTIFTYKTTFLKNGVTPVVSSRYETISRTATLATSISNVRITSSIMQQGPFKINPVATPSFPVIKPSSIPRTVFSTRYHYTTQYFGPGSSSVVTVKEIHSVIVPLNPTRIVLYQDGPPVVVTRPISIGGAVNIQPTVTISGQIMSSVVFGNRTVLYIVNTASGGIQSTTTVDQNLLQTTVVQGQPTIYLRQPVQATQAPVASINNFGAQDKSIVFGGVSSSTKTPELSDNIRFIGINTSPTVFLPGKQPNQRTSTPGETKTTFIGSGSTTIEGATTIWGSLFTKPVDAKSPQIKYTNAENTEINGGIMTRFITYVDSTARTIVSTRPMTVGSVSTNIVSTRVYPKRTMLITVIGDRTMITYANAQNQPLDPTDLLKIFGTTRSPVSPTINYPKPTTTRVTEDASVLLNAGFGNGLGQQPVTPKTTLTTSSKENGAINQVDIGQSDRIKANGDDCHPTCKINAGEICQKKGDHNFHCVCRPGFVRSGSSCKAVRSYLVKIPLSKMGQTTLYYKTTYRDPRTTEYKTLSEKSKQGSGNVFTSSSAVRQYFYGNKVVALNDMSSLGGNSQNGVLANVVVHVSNNSVVDPVMLKKELMSYVTTHNYTLGQTDLVTSHSADAYTVEDFNECLNPEFNDCPKDISECRNNNGSFTCVCKGGFADENPQIPGRFCSDMNAFCDFCSYHGVCVQGEDGHRFCKCDKWYLGKNCQVNGFALAIILPIIAGLLLIAVMIWLCCCCRKGQCCGGGGCCGCCQPRHNKGAAAVMAAGGMFPILGGAGTGAGTLDKKAMIAADTSSESSGEQSRLAHVADVFGGGAGTHKSRKSGTSYEDRSISAFVTEAPVLIPRAKHQHPKQFVTASTENILSAEDGLEYMAAENKLMSILDGESRHHERNMTIQKESSSFATMPSSAKAVGKSHAMNSRAATIERSEHAGRGGASEGEYSAYTATSSSKIDKQSGLSGRGASSNLRMNNKEASSVGAAAAAVARSSASQSSEQLHQQQQQHHQRQHQHQHQRSRTSTNSKSHTQQSNAYYTSSGQRESMAEDVGHHHRRHHDQSYAYEASSALGGREHQSGGHDGSRESAEFDTFTSRFETGSTGRYGNTTTMSMARSFDETTIHPDTRRIGGTSSYYSSSKGQSSQFYREEPYQTDMDEAITDVSVSTMMIPNAHIYYEHDSEASESSGPSAILPKVHSRRDNSSSYEQESYYSYEDKMEMSTRRIGPHS